MRIVYIWKTGKYLKTFKKWDRKKDETRRPIPEAQQPTVRIHKRKMSGEIVQEHFLDLQKSPPEHPAQ